MPGLSQFFDGKVKRGIILYLISQILILLAVLILVQPIQPFNIILPVIIIVSVYLFVIVDSVTCAKYPDTSLKTHLILVGIILFIINTSFIQPTIGRTIGENIVEPFQIPSVSMNPSLLIGDFIFASKLPHNREPKRGDIVVFYSPTDPSRRFIRRVVGLSGDVIEVKDNNLYVNSIKQKEDFLIEPSVEGSDITNEAPKSFGPAVAPEGSIFVLSDNRKYGSDSRSWGFLDKNQIIGKASIIYWSWDKDDRRIRWDRIGKSIM